MKILVYGWYHQANIGDELFMDAFRKLFPDYEFSFHKNVDKKHLENVDAIFFGGGSFLYGKPRITEEALQIIKTKPIFYLGVGVEAEVHPTHLELIKLARLIATRSPDQVERLKTLNPNSKWIPDLIYALQDQVVFSPKIKRSVLVIPNISVVPNHKDAYWMHASWNHFKSEFAQFLDVLIEDKYKVDFLSFCNNVELNDNWPAGEIIGHMTHRGNHMLPEQPIAFDQITKLMSKYEVIVTQRFHGIVLSEMVKTPYVALHHHDKLKSTVPNNGLFLSYYNSSKSVLLDSFKQAVGMNFSNLPIEYNIFKNLVDEVRNLI